MQEWLYIFGLLIESNFFTFVCPNTAYGILGTLAGPCLTRQTDPSVMKVLQRFPLVLLFNWSNLFIFDLANQRHPDSVKEDLVNKRWRPLPTGRITPEQTRRLTLIAIPTVLALNFTLGVWRETALFLILTWLYNDLRGGDEIIRDFIIAFAFALYNYGSLQIATDANGTVTQRGYIWIMVTSGVVLTTMQVQDLRDQAGDRGGGRRTVPLVFGDTTSRWIIAILVPLWSYFCAFFWGLQPWAYALPMIGGYIAFHALRMRSLDADTQTWKLWYLWTSVLYVLPLIHRFQGRKDPILAV